MTLGRPTGARLAVCLGLLAIARASVAAQAPQDYLPSDTVFFISCPDLDRTAAAFKQTELHRLWNEPEVQQFVRQPIDAAKAAIKAKIAQMKAEMGARSDLTSEDLQGVFGGHATLALLGLGLEQRQTAGESRVSMKLHPPVVVVIGIRDPEKYAATCSKLDAAMSAAPQAQAGQLTKEVTTIRGSEVVVWSGKGKERLCRASAKNMCVLTSTEDAMACVLDGLTGAAGQSTLSERHSLKAVQQRLGGKGCDFLMYLDTAQVLRELGPVIPPDASRALDVLGLSSVESLALGAAITPPGIKDAVYLHVPGERRGVFKLFPPGDVSRDLLQLVPANAQSARIGRFNFLRLWTEIDQAWSELHPVSYGQFQAGLERLEERLQLDIKQDLLATLGENFVVSAASSGAPGLGALTGMSLLWEVQDAARLRDALAQIRAATTPRPAAAKGKVPRRPAQQWRELPHGDLTIHYLTLRMPFVSPSYAVTPKYLVLGLQPMAVKQTIDRMSTAGPDIRTKPDFQQVSAHVAQSSVMLGYADIKQAALQAYVMLPLAVGILQTKGANLPIDMATLPTAQTVTKHLFGAAGALTCDSEGICVEYYSPVGGLVLGGAVATAGGAAVLTLRTRKAARRARTAQPPQPAQPARPARPAQPAQPAQP